ncbi:MAG: class I SAM-dependent methyltransferase [Prolixibacteraceae bacterium]|jgi:ubiquinone/menaquinone biosynthesis C-methylase UbiE|nr:class I SAM-dependent methyltransferase [Prolixibacteraceae bacterium]
MKYKYIAITILTMTTLTVTAQNMSIFSRATKSGWYPEFLNPVIDAITSNDKQKEILDIGTGPGMLPLMLIKKDSSIQIVGIDIDSVMIDEARRRVAHKNVMFQHQKLNSSLEFADNQFDIVTFCSVLFLVGDSVKTNLMNEALRVLKPKGKIIILTPSGRKSVLSSFIEVWRYRFSFNNLTFPIWKIATSSGGRKWQIQKWLEQYARENHLNYKSSLTFNNNASLETISKNK